MRRGDFIKVVAGSGSGVALYFAYPNRVQLVAGEGRSYLLSLNAPADDNGSERGIQGQH
jgi:hypothetical protein